MKTATDWKPTITTATHIHDDVMDCIRYMKDYENKVDHVVYDHEGTVLTEEKLELMCESFKIIASVEFKLSISDVALKAVREYWQVFSTKVNPNSKCSCGSGHKFKKCCGRKK